MNRLDTKTLQAVLKASKAHLDVLEAGLTPLIPLLTPDERQRTLRPPEAFPEAGRSLARATDLQPALAASVGYDRDAVLEDLANADALKAFLEQLERIQRRAADGKLTALAEAYVPSLQLFGVSKILAQQNAELQALVDPLADVFATPRQRGTKPETK